MDSTSASSSSSASASSAASRQARGKSAAGTWQWARTAETQRALLDAAREVFVEQGFSQASIAEVVERAGSSVGSLYHHFGGKSELYVALWQEYQQAQEEAAAGAVAAAKRAGVTDPFELFSAGARAYLEGSWQHRDLTVLFLSGDTPPGFGVMARTRGHQWISQNDTLLGLSDTSFDRLYATILTQLIGEGAREVAVAKNRQQASRVADAVIEYVQRIMANGPWSPAVKPVGTVRADRADRAGRAERAERGTRRASARADSPTD
ncbi:TetR/AcrR family transcriptional regulator [Trebonia kvetii]|uniref:TetR/AcrR family transcriptional regulator n=1 Tax=Trebonia kvetii TaxID=2480626 RepID=UPI001FEA43C2|nr:TetR/AcrR family transcriptional regulator [Trebonia kvetii]